MGIGWLLKSGEFTWSSGSRENPAGPRLIQRGAKPLGFWLFFTVVVNIALGLLATGAWMFINAARLVDGSDR